MNNTLLNVLAAFFIIGLIVFFMWYLVYDTPCEDEDDFHKLRFKS